MRQASSDTRSITTTATPVNCVSIPRLDRGFWSRTWLTVRLRFSEKFLPSDHHDKIASARKTLRSLASHAAHTDTASRQSFYYALRSMDPLVFEEFILESFHRMGYPIRRNRRYSGDGGIDGHVHYEGRWRPIQCKRYRDTINPAHVEDFDAVLQARRVDFGLFVHTGRTGQKSRIGAQHSGRVRFISGETLCALIAGNGSGHVTKP